MELDTLLDQLEIPRSCLSVLSTTHTGVVYKISGSVALVLKVYSAPEQREMQQAEELGLKKLKEYSQILKVPLIHKSGLHPQPYLLIDYFTTDPGKVSQEQLGRGLASLHQSKVGDSYGFDLDTFCGPTIQSNKLSKDWSAFYLDQRLHCIIEQIVQQYPDEIVLPKLLDSISNRISELLPHQPKPSLLHGDLWSGNKINMAGQEFGLIDPAAYFGHSEAEFGAITMFGGFDESFFGAYQEILPSEPGYSDRLPIYQAYHYLNHYLLFGLSYRNGALTRLQFYT